MERYNTEIQNVTGHKSATALKVYKASSEIQQHKVSNALSIGSSSSSSSAAPKKRSRLVLPSGSKNFNFINNSTNSNIEIHNHYNNEPSADESSEDSSTNDSE